MDKAYQRTKDQWHFYHWSFVIYDNMLHFQQPVN